MKKYLIVLPAYNVEKELKELLPKMACYKTECLFIDDGSIDGTRDILLQQGFNVHTFNVNKGISECIQFGLNYAFDNGFEYIIMMDSDGQHDPRYLPDFITELGEYDAVLGNRFTNNTLIPSQKISSNCFASSFYEEIFGIRFGDVACGFKGIRLSKSLIEYLEGAEGYSIIYRIMSYICEKNIRWKKKPISAIYYPDNLLFTRNAELLALVKTLMESNKNINIDLKIKNIDRQIQEGDDFNINIAGCEFYGFYIDKYNGYIIQADMKHLAEYYSL